MVLLTTTPQILSAISLLPPDSPLLSSAPCSDSENEPPLPTTTETPISHKSLISISRALRSLPNPSSPPPPPRTTTNQSSYTLNTLLHNTRPYHPPTPTTPQPSASYLALKARLLHEKEQREYNALFSSNPKSQQFPLNHLTSNLPTEDTEETDDISPTLILNILLSILLCAFSVFYATRYWANDGVRVLLSLGGGIVVGLAETGIYAAYLRNVGVARGRERGRREVKSVIVEEPATGRGEGGGGEVVGNEVGVEKEEIWGRGVNGGVRRRVRERWEKEERKLGEEGGRGVRPTRSD